MYTCIWRVRMWTCLKHCFNIFATHGGLFLNQFCEVQSKRVPNTWREKCCRLEILWTFGRTAKPCLGVQLYLAIFIYVYNIYINNCIHIYNIYIYTIYIYLIVEVKSDGYTNFSSWTAPPSAESVFDSPKVIQGHPVASTTGCLFQFTQTFPYVAWRFIIHYLWPFPPWKNGGFPNHRVSKSTKSIMICLVAQFHHLEKYEFVNGKDYYPIYGKIVSTPLKNMRSSVGMMTFLTEWKNVPNHQTVFFPESVWAKGYSNSGGLSNIFTYSHLLIFSSSHPHILTFSLALLLSCPLALSFFSISLSQARGSQRDSTKRNPFARNEVRSPKTGVKLRFLLSGHNPFARHEVRQKLR